MSLIPRWLQFNVDPRKVLKEIAEKKKTRYQDDSQAAFVEVSDGQREVGKIFWHGGQDYLTGILNSEYNDGAATLLANSYDLEKIEDKVSEKTTIKQLAFSFKGMKTEDFEKAVRGAEHLYSAIEKYPKMCEGLRTAKNEGKHGNSTSDAA